MTGFCAESYDYRKHPAYGAFQKFFDSYFVERNYEKVLSFLDEDFYGVGIRKDEITFGKAFFSEKLRITLAKAQEKVSYKVCSFGGKEIAENIWSIIAVMEISLPTEQEELVFYETRFTGNFKIVDEDVLVLSAHMSEASGMTEEEEFLPLKYVEGKVAIEKEKTEKVVLDIMSKAMPGGIVSGYAADGFPLYFVNQQYLALLGYDSYEEYYEDAGGLGTTHIHPDDREMVNQQVMYSYSTDNQYGIEYRIRHRDGHYIHVYDIGKKMITPDNKEVIICVLYDMTENAKQKEILLHESSYDALTGIYNRGSGVRTIERALKDVKEYAFAFFDVDNLKLLNDVYNHTVGDLVLKHFAELLKENLGEKTILARLGGDEFVALFRSGESIQELEMLLSKMQKDYCSFIEQNYPESYSSVSIGCVSCRRSYSFDVLYQMTDKLMYDIKKSGKRGYKITDIS